MVRMKMSLMTCLRELASADFLKPDVPDVAIDMLREKGLVVTLYTRGVLITEKGRKVLASVGQDVPDELICREEDRPRRLDDVELPDSTGHDLTPHQISLN